MLRVFLILKWAWLWEIAQRWKRVVRAHWKATIKITFYWAYPVGRHRAVSGFVLPLAESAVKGSEGASGHWPVWEQTVLYPRVQELERTNYSREKNELEVANEREIDYEVGDIPTEREAWIRKNKDSAHHGENNERWRMKNGGKKLKGKAKVFTAKKNSLEKRATGNSWLHQFKLRWRHMPPLHSLGNRNPSWLLAALATAFSQDPGCHKMARATISECTAVKSWYLHVCDYFNK